jgi:hypothetical protein
LSRATKEDVESVSEKLRHAIERYTRLQSALSGGEVTSDPSWQRSFNAFYQVRRSADWRRVFYALLTKALRTRMTFETVLVSLFEATGRVETSFASKLISTADPAQPVIDQRVLNQLGLRLPKPADPARLSRIVGLHEEMRLGYKGFLGSAHAEDLVRRFSPPVQHVAPEKMVDLILWRLPYGQASVVATSDSGRSAANVRPS